MLPSLQEAFLHDISLPGVPVEILSKHYGNNCLGQAGLEGCVLA
jgi:hypothetical protein